jgi:hypothetical protein
MDKAGDNHAPHGIRHRKRLVLDVKDTRAWSDAALVTGCAQVAELLANCSFGVQVVVIKPPLPEGSPRQMGCGPLGVQHSQPGARLAGVAGAVAKAPTRGCPVEILRDPPNDEHGAVGPGVRRSLDALTGCVLIGLGIRLAAEQRRSHRLVPAGPGACPGASPSNQLSAAG